MTAIIVWIKRNWKLPVLSLALTLLSYAVLSPSLSFYLDDWPQLYSLEIRGIEGIKQYFLFDGRPYGFWPDLMVYRIVGNQPAWLAFHQLCASLVDWSFYVGNVCKPLAATQT